MSTRRRPRWRSRFRWGIPADLAGARLASVTNTTTKDGLPRLMVENVILTYVDSHGATFRLAVFDATAPRRTPSGGTGEPRPFAAREGGTAWALHQCLAAARGTAEATEAASGFRWWRQRVPVAFGVVLLLGALWAGYWLVPLAGASQVGGIVTEYRGSGYQCGVTWTDPATGRRSVDTVDCDGRREGDPIRVYVMGWPRSGTADDLMTVTVLAAMGGGFAVFFVGLIAIEQVVIRRRLRRLHQPT